MTKTNKILIIDDDRAICSSMSLLLKKRGFSPFTINHPSEVMGKISDIHPDLILLDMNFTIETSGRQGLALLRKIKDTSADLPVILITGWATVQLAVEGMKLGAQDFIAKPWDNHHLIQTITDIINLTKKADIGVKTNDSSDFTPKNIIGEAPNFMEVMDIAKRVAQTDANVLITGESGTGKEVVSEAIHEMSLRRSFPFVKVNLGGLPSSLFESEMFGHKKGAFTGAIADRKGRFFNANKGTIFLDEIGELPLADQVKLLRVLQERTYEPLGSSRSIKTDVRVICATNRDLQAMVAKGDFREDLFYRINLITIHLPALRDRRQDIPLLVDYFVGTTCNAYQIPRPKIDQKTLDWLGQQPFPGNIRQLKNIIERTILLHIGSSQLTLPAFKKYALQYANATDVTLPEVGELTLQEMEVNMITKALDYHEHSISQTAASLGITRSALYRRLEKYNIRHEPKG